MIRWDVVLVGEDVDGRSYSEDIQERLFYLLSTYSTHSHLSRLHRAYVLPDTCSGTAKRPRRCRVAAVTVLSQCAHATRKTVQKTTLGRLLRQVNDH